MSILNILGLVSRLKGMSIDLLIHNFKVFAEKPVLNQLRPAQIKDWSKTWSSVFLGLVWFFSVLR